MKVYAKLFNRLNSMTVWLTSRPSLNPVSRPVMRALGAATLWMKKGRPQTSVEGLAEEWQRMFPSRKMVPIREIRDDTIIAEITSYCPYRGSGKLDGCYRMMEYDRKMLETLGGEMVVLRSQAEPGVSCCKLAIRPRGAGMDDLVPAHLRAGAEKPAA